MLICALEPKISLLVLCTFEPGSFAIRGKLIPFWGHLDSVSLFTTVGVLK
jgi:hypothetical protein